MPTGDEADHAYLVDVPALRARVAELEAAISGALGPLFVHDAVAARILSDALHGPSASARTDSQHGAAGETCPVGGATPPGSTGRDATSAGCPTRDEGPSESKSGVTVGETTSTTHQVAGSTPAPGPMGRGDGTVSADAASAFPRSSEALTPEDCTELLEAGKRLQDALAPRVHAMQGTWDAIRKPLLGPRPNEARKPTREEALAWSKAGPAEPEGPLAWSPLPSRPDKAEVKPHAPDSLYARALRWIDANRTTISIGHTPDAVEALARETRSVTDAEADRFVATPTGGTE